MTERLTTRERREARAERLRGWADGREAKADERLSAAHAATDGIPMGQPILVGHHSQRRHERAIERGDNAMRASIEHSNKAGEMRGRAANIEAQNARAIYSDDPDAIERLTAKIEAAEQARDAMKARNAEYRKAHRAELKGLTAYGRDQVLPHPSWQISNATANIGRDRKRLAQLQREAEHGPTLRTITARFDGECSECGAALSAGQTIKYTRATGARCPGC